MNAIQQASSSSTRRFAIMFAAASIGFIVAASLDGWASRSLRVPGFDNKDWGRTLRVLGFWPVWIIVSVVLIIHDSRTVLRPPLRDRFTRGVLIALSSGLSGMLAEVVKLLVRRVRPGIGESLWSTRLYTDRPFSTSDLSLPSGHSAIAFGAIFMLIRLHPGAWPLWLALGIGCAVQRVLAYAHYVSDVYASAILGYACAAMLWAMHMRSVRRDQQNRSLGAISA